MQVNYPQNRPLMALLILLLTIVLSAIVLHKSTEDAQQKIYDHSEITDTSYNSYQIKKAPRVLESFSNKKESCYFKSIAPEIAFITTGIKTSTFIFSNVNCNPAAIITCAVHAPDRLFGFIFINHFNKPKTLTLFCFAVFNNPERLYRPKITKNSC